MASKFDTCIYADYFAEYSMRTCTHPKNKDCAEAPCQGCKLHTKLKTGLKPCPFCKSSGVSLYDDYAGLNRRKWYVRCYKCEARGPTTDDAQGAKDAWNARA